MAGSSSNLDGPSFSGSYNNKMERSSSFREASENSRVLRSVQSSSSTEMPALSQYLSLEPVSLLGEQHKYSRSGELRRVLGVCLEDHSSFGSAQSNKAPIPDELKRFKASLADSSSKARERVKLFQEAITSVDKYKSVVSKRRQRNNEMSSEKPAFSKLSGAHQGPSAAEISAQRPNEDRPKNLLPNKRARSSLAESRSEGRGGSAMRQASVNNNTEKQRNSFEKDKNAPGASEEKPRGLAPGGEGWEKKLKRKRSVGSMVNRANDSGEPKPAQQRPTSSNSNAETRAARFNDNGLPFRSGLGSTGLSKTEQSKVKVESDNHPSDRRDKDRSLPKSNKMGMKDEPQSSSGGNNNNNTNNTNNPSNSKAKASRGPRSNSFVVMNSSPSFSRFPNNSSSDAWDPPSKSQSPTAPATSAPNRKRAAANPGPPSPSPPVAQWVGQRPHKIQRTRRAHVVSPVSNFEDGPPTNETSPSGSQRSGRNNDAAVASSPVTGLSESEESKGKGTENGELGENNNSKTMSLSSKKNSRVMLKEELGDGGVRRQGRTGRGGTTHARSASLLSVPKDTSKMEVTETVPKPPKSGRPASSDKNDSRIGRPPLKKTVDRKSHGRLAQSFQTGPLDITGGEQEDDKEELMAAINGARSACSDASTGSFWKKMEPVFSLPSSHDLSFLKTQIAFAQELDKNACDILAAGYNEDKSGMDQESKSDDWFDQAIPLSERLLSAFISTEDLLITENGNNDHHYPSSFDNKGLGFCNGFGVDAFLESNNNNNSNGVNRQNGSMSHQASLYECQFEEMSFDDRILVELHSIGIYPDSAPELDEGDGEIEKAIFDLQNQLTDQVKEKKLHLHKLEKVIQDVKVNEERHLEQSAMNKLVERACKKLSKQGGRGGSNHKNSNGNKITRQLAQAFAKRTLARCHKFDQTGRSCFADPAFKDLLFAPLPRPDSKPTDGGGEKGRKLERGPSDLYVKPEIQKERTKKREVLLDEVSRGAATSSFGGPKWKKSDQNKDNKNSNAKGRVRGERKNKAKPKQQKMAHLSAAAPAHQNNSEAASGSGTKRGQQEGLTGLTGQTKDGNEGLFTELPLSLDDLDVAGDGQDLESWLNVDDEALQDNDLVGLQIPMDDLADLTFN